MKMLTVLNKFYKSLEQDERQLRERIAASFDSALAEAMVAIYAFLIAGRAIDRITRDRARDLFRKVSDTRLTNRKGQLITFDEIHRLTNAEALVLDLSASQAKQARKTYDILRAHFRDESIALWDMMNMALSLGLPLNAQTIEAMAVDPEYPVLQTLINSHMKIARTVARDAMQAQAKGAETLDIINQAADHLRKKNRQAADAVMYFEDTRIATDTIFSLYDMLDEAEGESSSFRTICVHDDKTCETCLAIEAEQAAHPVPIEAKVTGVNAPPFHPFCRCRIEIVR